MNTIALFLSTALAFYSEAQDADLQFPPLAAAPAAAAAVQDAEPADEAPQLLSDETAPEDAPQTIPDAAESDAVTGSADEAPVALPDRDADFEAGQAEAVARETARVQAWFDELDTLRARFTQFSPDGSQSDGVLSLDRPGRARFDYDDPSPILLVADGSTVAIADFQLETLDRVPLGATPLAPLLETDETLAQTGAVTDAGRAEGRLYLTLVDPDGETDGRLTLIFDDPDADRAATDMVLAGWYAVDALGGLTEVRLTEVETGIDLDPRLFILDDEDVFADDRRRGRRR